MLANARQQDKDTVPLKIRLKAWWNGYDPAEVERLLRAHNRKKAEKAARKAEKHGVESSVNAHDIELPFDPWDDRRAEVAQYIWGEGYCGPGGPEHIISISKLLALSPEQSLLDVGARLGGPARTLAEKFGVWVTGFEDSERLVDLANDKSHMAGMMKKVAVSHYDPETIDSFERKFDRAFSKEALFTIENKKGLIETVEQHLKPSGLFLLREFVLADDRAYSDPAFKEWREAEAGQARNPYMATAHGLVEIIKDAGLNVRVNEDVTDEYIRLVNQGWAGADKVAESLAERDDADELLMTLLSEAEFWSRRVRLMEKGLLRVWRVLASKRADKPSMLSDW